MGDRSRESPAEISRDIEARRSAMAETLGAIEARVAPDRLADAAVQIARREGADIARAVSNRVRAQPVAAAVAAVGLAWLLFGGDASGRRRSATHRLAPSQTRRRDMHPSRAKPRPRVPEEAPSASSTARSEPQVQERWRAG